MPTSTSDGALEGVVYEAVGPRCRVKDPQGRWWRAVVRGRFRLHRFQTTNPVAVGDRVTFRPAENSRPAVIEEIHPRRTFLVRRANKLSKRYHVIAANVDRLLILFTLERPVTSPRFVDRLLVAAEAYHIQPMVVINKIDLYTSERLRRQAARWQALYQSLGYPVLEISAVRGDGFEALKAALHDGTNLIVGQSGAGKTTILNRLMPHLDLPVQEVSEYSGKGRHTTTVARMYDYDAHTRIIDTPGIRDFGLVGFEPYEISHFFPEMRPFIPQCRFNNCLHRQEPDCAVRAAVEAGRISPERYESYLRILENPN